MTTKGRKIHRRAKKVGAYLTDDNKRAPGGLLYTVGAARARDFQLGKLGPASAVRKIDPATGEVIETIPIREAVARQKVKPATGRRIAKKNWFLGENR